MPELLPTLPKIDWMTSDQTVTLMQALKSNGSDVRFVGGCVRDTILKNQVTDIDIGTPDPPNIVMNLLKRANIRSVPTGATHGTITAIMDTKYFQITSLRRDIETNGRHAKVTFSDNWVEDVKRRDFTINCLSANLDGEIFDPLDGMDDLANQKIVFVGNPADRIKEDHLRILRFYRFHGLFNSEICDSDGTYACKDNALLLKRLSKERKRDEFLKILLAKKPAKLVARMQSDGILDFLLPEAKNVTLLRSIDYLSRVLLKNFAIKASSLCRLAALLDPFSVDIFEVANTLKLSRNQAIHLSKICSSQQEIHPNLGLKDEKKIFYGSNVAALRDIILLQWARELIRKPKLNKSQSDGWLNLLKRCQEWHSPNFPLTGRDVLNAGVSPGRTVGEILQHVEDWWTNSEFMASRDECLNQLKKQIKQLNIDKKE